MRKSMQNVRRHRKAGVLWTGGMVISRNDMNVALLSDSSCAYVHKTSIGRAQKV